MRATLHGATLQHIGTTRKNTNGSARLPHAAAGENVGVRLLAALGELIRWLRSQSGAARRQWGRLGGRHLRVGRLAVGCAGDDGCERPWPQREPNDRARRGARRPAAHRSRSLRCWRCRRTVTVSIRLRWREAVLICRTSPSRAATRVAPSPCACRLARRSSRRFSKLPHRRLAKRRGRHSSLHIAA